MRECDVLEEREVRARLQRHPEACMCPVRARALGLQFSGEGRGGCACGLAWAEPHTWMGQMGEATGIKNTHAQAESLSRPQGSSGHDIRIQRKTLRSQVWLLRFITRGHHFSV